MEGLTLQIYAKGSDKAVEFYQKAFDAELRNIHKNDDGTFSHVELTFYGFEIAVSESWFGEVIKGNPRTEETLRIYNSISNIANAEGVMLKPWEEDEYDIKIVKIQK